MSSSTSQARPARTQLVDRYRADSKRVGGISLSSVRDPIPLRMPADGPGCGDNRGAQLAVSWIVANGLAVDGLQQLAGRIRRCL